MTRRRCGKLILIPTPPVSLRSSDMALVKPRLFQQAVDLIQLELHIGAYLELERR